MSKKNLRPEKIPIITRLLQPSPKYYHQCTEETRRSIKSLAFVLLFTSLVCGAIFAASICQFCLGADYRLFLPVLCFTGLFYFLVDRPIVFSNANSHSRMVKWLRLAIALVLGLFNSFLIDTFYFKDDIESARVADISQKELALRKDAGIQDSLLLIQKNAVIREMDSAAGHLSAKRDSLNAEADGHGGSGRPGMKAVWQSKYAMYRADSIALSEQQAIKLQVINSIDSQRSAKAALLQAQVNDLPRQVSTGINQNMQALHQIIWLNGNFTNILMSILILLISMIFELAPLISKMFYNTSEYFEKYVHEKELRDKQTILAKNKDMHIIGSKVLLEQKRDELRMFRESAEDNLRDTIAFNAAVLEQSVSELNRLDTLDQQLKKRHPRYYQTHIQPLLESAYTNLHQASKSTIAHP